MKNSMSTILPSFGIWSKLERWKSSISRCLMSWPQIKKIVLLKCCLCLFYTTTTSHFLIKLRCAMKIGFYMTTGDDQLNGWTEKKLQSSKALPKVKLPPKIGHGHGGLLPIWSTTAFWIPAKSLHVRSICSAYLWDAPKTTILAAGIG